MATVEKNDRQVVAPIERFLQAAIKRLRGTDRSLTIERCPSCEGQAGAVACPHCQGEGFVDQSTVSVPRATADSLKGLRS